MQYAGLNNNTYPYMSKFVFFVFTIMLPIMLLNMLIAMMANTYSTVISMSEKEWVKAVRGKGVGMEFIYTVVTSSYVLVRIILKINFVFGINPFEPET